MQVKVRSLPSTLRSTPDFQLSQTASGMILCSRFPKKLKTFQTNIVRGKVPRHNIYIYISNTTCS